MKNQFAIQLIAVGALLTSAAGTCAHIVLEEPAAPAGSSYRAVFRVGHGCAGSATTAIRVTLPPGFRGAKPMPKAGWTLTTATSKLEASYESHGKTVTEDVSEVSWTAASKEHWLADAFYDEFVLRGTLPTRVGPLWFKVLQSCETGASNWAEVPASGTSTQGLKAPAALLEVRPAAAPAGHQH